ncbi:MAG: ImmA/IrrE family metallo-endopeptidase [Sphingomonadales bacterium]|nr:ImmA/IrrE family metallo-endopeptidase [Sphingomonadaceae bacterium]MBS3931656.1 ImmA/IrrE family metallo-endopeptidase [Sphingomonadales bacterium]
MSSRLAERLKSLGISTESLVSKTTLSRQRASEIIGGSKANVSEIRDICSGLRLPVQIFAEGGERKSKINLAPLFREVRSASNEYDITVERISIFVEACLEILPRRNSLPDWLDQFPSENKTYAAADRLSKVARFVIDPEDPNGPLPDLGLRLGNLEGLIVSKLPHSRYEGISLIAGNYCFIFVSPRFPARMLFTLGHEFGHLISDHTDGGFVRFEKAKQIGSFGESSKVESFVDAFASCLLIPDTGLGKFLVFAREHLELDTDRITDRDILLISRFFGVSFDVAGLRLEHLGLIPHGLTYSLGDYLRKEFKSPEKRADMLGISPREKINFPNISPQLSVSLLAALRSGDVSIGWASNSFGFSIGEIFAEQAKVQ